MNFLSLILILVAIGTLTNYKKNLKTYSVKKITDAIDLSGNGDDPLWATACELSDFSYPWEKGGNPATKFKALHSHDWLYCFFDVTDPEVNIHQVTNHKREVASSSRTEIFFKTDDKLNPYYCLEIDPLARVLDYRGTYHRKFDLNWSWPAEQLIVKTTQRKDGYSVEFAISKVSLANLGLLQNKTLQAGLFRADRSAENRDKPHFKWISWVHPESETPDFHIPSAFGILRLED